MSTSMTASVVELRKLRDVALLKLGLKKDYSSKELRELSEALQLGYYDCSIFPGDLSRNPNLEQQLRMLAGPHGWTIYKAMLAKRKGGPCKP